MRQRNDREHSGGMVEYSVGLVGFSDHRASLLRLVLRATPQSPYQVHVAAAEALPPIDIAIVDVGDGFREGQLAPIRGRCPRAAFVYVSEHGFSGDSRFRLDRKTVLARIRSTLEIVVRDELQKEKVLPISAVRAAPPFETPPTARPTSSAFSGVASGPETASAADAVRILVVDDSPAIRSQVRAGLERIGLRCDEAADSEQAMSLIQRRWYDLALFDVVMPGVDGYELCRRLKHDGRTRRLPIILLTSRSSPFDRARGALVGCDSYLVKPIAWDKFHAAIDLTLRKAFHANPSVLSARGYTAGAQRQA